MKNFKYSIKLYENLVNLFGEEQLGKMASSEIRKDLQDEYDLAERHVKVDVNKMNDGFDFRIAKKDIQHYKKIYQAYNLFMDELNEYEDEKKKTLSETN